MYTQSELYALLCFTAEGSFTRRCHALPVFTARVNTGSVYRA